MNPRPQGEKVAEVPYPYSCSIDMISIIDDDAERDKHYDLFNVTVSLRCISIVFNVTYADRIEFVREKWLEMQIPLPVF